MRQKAAHLSRVRLSHIFCVYSSDKVIVVKFQTTVFEEEHEEQKHVEKEVERLRKMYDDLKIQSVRQKKDLDALKDSVKDLELDSQRPHMEDNEYTRRIRSLENKLDKAMIKFNEAQSIRKTYEQIVRRLSEERVGFDNQLSAIERTLGAKQRDLEELILLAGDATHARDTALAELEKVRAGYEEERKKREKELRERHQSVQARRQMLERMKLRENLRHQMANSHNKPQSPDQELRNSLTQKSLTMEKIESRNKVNIFENAFRKIKEATGVSDVNEVIQKIISQESSTENLISVTRENQSKIESLNEMKKKIKARCEELKYSGVGGGQHRKMVDSYEDQLANSSTRLERARLKYDRLSKIVISMKAGIGHLQDKLEGFRDEIGGKSFIIVDETASDALRECELCFETLMKRIKAGEEEAKRVQMTSFLGSSGALKSGGLDLSAEIVDEQAANLSTLRPFNQRIDLNFSADAVGGNNGIYESAAFGSADDASLGDLDDDELTRDKVKRASTQILMAMDKKKKKPKKKGGGPGDSMNDDRVGSASSPSRPRTEA